MIGSNLPPRGTSHEPRVLHVVRNLNFGGLEVGVVNLVNGLHKFNLRQAVCCLEQAGTLAEQLPEDVPAWSCAGQDHWLRKRLPLQAARYMRRFQPHVVHARNCGAWVDAAVAWLLAGRPGRLCFSIHGWDRLDRLPWQRALLYRQLARLTDTLAAVSPETVHEFSRETGIPASRFTVLYSGVDTDRFHPPSPGAGRAGPVVFGCVGRLDPVKGHDLLIRAFAQAIKVPGVDAELQLIGDGPCREQLEDLARACGVEQRVRILGARHDVPDLLRNLDVFVLASHREGRPTSVMEAMASGLPVVATNVGSVRELVTEGVSGFVVRPGDLEGLATALARLATDPTLRERLGTASRQRAVRDLSLDRMVRNYLEFYCPGRSGDRHVTRAGGMGMGLEHLGNLVCAESQGS